MKKTAALSVIFATLVALGLLPLGVKGHDHSYEAQAVPSHHAATIASDATNMPNTTQLPKSKAQTPGLAQQASTTQSLSPRAIRRLERSYQKVWRLVKDNYYDRNKLVSAEWSSWEHRFDGNINSKNDLRVSLKTMLDSLDDDYTYMLSQRQVADRAGSTHMHKVVNGAVLGGNIGYVRLRNFTADGVEDEFNDALSKMDATSGIILDLRGNHGGYIEKAQRLFALLADKGAFMSYHGYQDGISDTKVLRLTPRAWEIMQNGMRKLEPRQSNAA